MTAPTSDRESCTTPCAQDHLRELVSAAESFGPCVDLADRWGTRLAAVLDAGGRLLAAGNGGRGAQAQHLPAGLAGRYRAGPPPFTALCPTAETATGTSPMARRANSPPIA